MAARVPVLLALTCLAAGCGGREQAEPASNDAQRQAEQLQKQAEAISRQAENGTAEIERALENEGAIIFDNRENLLNQVATNDTAPAEGNAAQPAQ